MADFGLSITKVAGDMKSNAIDFVNKYRFEKQQKQQNNVGPGSMSHMLANYSQYTNYTPCGRTDGQYH